MSATEIPLPLNSLSSSLWFPDSSEALFDCAQAQLASVRINGTSEIQSNVKLTANNTEPGPRVAWMSPGSFLRHNSSHGWQSPAQRMLHGVTEQDSDWSSQQIPASDWLMRWEELSWVSQSHFCVKIIELTGSDIFLGWCPGHVTSHLSRVLHVSRVTCVTRAPYCSTRWHRSRLRSPGLRTVPVCICPWWPSPGSGDPGP